MGARFKLDENVPRDAAVLVRTAGHDVHSVLDEKLGGGTDTQLLDVCRKEDRILITLDLDFADIRSYRPSDSAGIWVLRPPLKSIESTLAVLQGALALLATDAATQRLWIVEQDRVRIRDD